MVKLLSEAAEVYVDCGYEVQQAVLAVLDIPESPEALSQAEIFAEVVSTFVWSYTRGKGFRLASEGVVVPGRGVRSVIVSATARYMSNPQQLKRESAGEQSVTYADLNGFTLAEQAVLNLYRRRTA